MMRSLYSGVSGLKAHQTKMDVIGNNIANVNTVGFKSSRVTFSELFYQTTQVASGPNADTNTGGQNAKQIGLGTNMGSISVDVTTEGGTQSTGNPFDLKISGDSFFVVSSGGANYFTKAGNFTTDASGNLVTQSGGLVMGYIAETPGAMLQTDQIRPLSIYGAQYTNTPPEITTAATYSGNINSEDSNFAEGLPITTFIPVYDNLGYKYEVQVQVTKVSATEYTAEATGVYSGNQLIEDLTAEMSGTLTFDGATGLIAEGSESSFELTLSGKDSFTSPVTVDFSSLTCYGNESTIDCVRGDKNGEGAGKAVGTMISVGVQTDGKIVAAYSNGDNEVIGQIAVANFSNPAGLEKVGDNLFAATLNSGEFNGIGEDVTANGGSISSGTLEMSNVDLSTEFTDMIVTQRGFQANSRIITTSDTMIEELLSLKR
ncbi:MAG: flagellar hook protein FlgE [Lachnospiraceae bacterium]|nr:flagellar hook protein FlgE [Lachnospiraceae bacterium]